MSITRSAKATNTKGVKVKSKTPSTPKQVVARVSKPAVKPSQNTAPIKQSSKATRPALATAQTAAELKPASKHKIILDLLMSQGASIADLMKATGWQAHSIRGFISGTIKNKLGLPVIRKKQDGVLIYSIAKQKMSADIREQLLELETLSRSDLAVRWQACFGVSAPHLCRSALLRQVIAWQMQSKALGGLTALERRQIQSGSSKPSIQANTGSRLVRVWQGKTHQVTVLDSGYLYEGKTWKSLSAIAHHITGTPWSGPVFFGLKKTHAKQTRAKNGLGRNKNQTP